ncbi:HAMP domain-containing histidine kinase [Paraburkholderia sp. CNPSo 3274]|uniref:two-component system sensor histidine kinase NtrB n=1 Tax=Paraburkholderia sp. CNPSo 3274 TaxID=2940932 RepID=UPI0020B6D1FD|nr:HAMP domain-containing sensor histidine kinase [Paraburkholderia sp. CNPSo 3274]MCP3713291.1 HAMP domain-containing histidine kinase [Paraburkholderia sp. CNPSo 3274]
MATLLSWLARFTVHGLPPAVPRRPPRTGQSFSADAQSLRGVLDIVPVMALVLDGAGRIALANGRATRVLGYASEEITGMPVDTLLVPSGRDERPVSLATLQGAVGLPQIVTRDALARAKNGSDIEVRVTASSVPVRDQREWVVVVIEPDTANAATTGSADGDQRRLHRERALEVGDMAAALAHEVDQPLTAILSNAQAAQRFRALNPPAFSDLRELLGEVVDDSTRAHAIIRKMRQSTNSGPPEANPIDVGSLVGDVIRRLRRDTEACGAAVTATIDEGVPQLLGDAIQLQQVLVNLLMNALDAIHECRSEDRSICVVVTATRDRSTVCIAVRDRGAGVSAEQFATLFKPFVTSKPQGLGLGLPISRTIVIAHGGQMWAERNADRGLTFHIELPAGSATVKTDTRLLP